MLVQNGCGVTGAAGSASLKIIAMGFVATAENADRDDYSKTLIIYKNDDKEEAAEAIADKLGCGRVQQNDGDFSFDGDILVIIGLDFE